MRLQIGLDTIAYGRKLHVLVHALTALLLALAAATPLWVPDLALTLFGWQRWLLAAAAIVALLGLIPYRPWVARLSLGLCLAVSTLAIGVGALELLFRIIRYDFNRTAAALQRLPPFFRKPLVPSGSVFYRRAGPQRWTGRVLYTALAEQHIRPNPYTDEPAITVSYDATGFRNEAGLTDWELAVAGDSFTELGHLPFEALFTTQLGRRLGQRVRNLGTSHTGPWTHLHYLKAFGLAPSLRQTVIMFYEGNDLADLALENEALELFAATGKRPARGQRPQTSFLRATREAFRRSRHPPRSFAPLPHAWFDSASGREPLTLLHTPAVLSADLPDTTRHALTGVLREYVAFATPRGIRPRLAYVPTKEAVLRGLVTLTADGPAAWETGPPSDLASYVAGQCAETGVEFLDLTPALVAETRRTRALLYNGMVDTHLNDRGAAVVARELAAWLDRSEP